MSCARISSIGLSCPVLSSRAIESAGKDLPRKPWPISSEEQQEKRSTNRSASGSAGTSFRAEPSTAWPRSSLNATPFPCCHACASRGGPQRWFGKKSAEPKRKPKPPKQPPPPQLLPPLLVRGKSATTRPMLAAAAAIVPALAARMELNGGIASREVARQALRRLTRSSSTQSNTGGSWRRCTTRGCCQQGLASDRRRLMRTPTPTPTHMHTHTSLTHTLLTHTPG
mmetsp:Transcript_6585/g.12121  ORF Transcript_6585/g.12121 Transcript_6585/m.12121 type:complete len:226 (-) Transcript_6585:1239-1916(-)